MSLGVVFWLAAMLVTVVGAVLFLGFLAERGAPPHGSEAVKRPETEEKYG